MINTEDILYIGYLKKSEFTGSDSGMRYRLEKWEETSEEKDENGNDIKKTVLKATIWPEPFNFFTTPDSEKESNTFSFDEDGISDAVRWMNDRLFEDKARWDAAVHKWDKYNG
ncbi:MAG: GNAT family acetyltransferase [Lachnospiraceae bacterium]|nr:GNAT family acetyltransferase [Lachnospiraceae bacterium]